MRKAKNERSLDPLKMTKSRKDWLLMIKAGQVRAVRAELHTGEVSQPRWQVAGIGRMVRWLDHPRIRHLWRPSVDIAPLNESHTVLLTVEGHQVLERWRDHDKEYGT